MCSSVALQSTFSNAACNDVFFTRDLRSNLCHYQSTRPSWCHPDAPSWNTHRPLCLLRLRFWALFFCEVAPNTYTDARPLTLIHERRCTLWNQRRVRMHTQVQTLKHTRARTLTNHPLSEVDAAVENKRQISYFTSRTLACFCSLLTCLATSEDQELN